jgi:two-component system, chemotaxis family, chemotaxis protein CheY
VKQILIVDDAATVRMYHRLILEGAGYQVDEAVNGIEALEKAFRTDYALYLVDVNMPKFDGYSFIKEIRGNATMSQAPAVMISTEAQACDLTKAYEAGANFYLIKPTRPPVLLSHVRVLLGETG